VKSVAAHLVRATLGVRKQLVGMRTEMINQIRGLMKIFGLILPKGSGGRFEADVRARLAEHAELGLVIEPLLAAWRALDGQVAALERQLVRRARRHEVCHRLMTVPGVGPLTALAFVTTVDDPARFRRSSSVGAYLGLTPRRHQSGERDVSGRISKCGDRLTRSYLFEAANVLLTRVERWSSLKASAVWPSGAGPRRRKSRSRASSPRCCTDSGRTAPPSAGPRRPPRDDLIARGSPIGERGPCRDDARASSLRRLRIRSELRARSARSAH
jgi:transposase